MTCHALGRAGPGPLWRAGLWQSRAGTIKEAIVQFEPRVMGASLAVKALDASSMLDTHNVIEFEITGVMWAQPVPLELLLRTQVDLEAGQIQVRDMAGGPPRRKP